MRQNHLGAAWLNRGHALLLASDHAAITSFENAIAALTFGAIRDNPSARRNLAGAHTNLAHALLSSVPGGAEDPAPAGGPPSPRIAAPEAASKLGPDTRGRAQADLLRAAQSARAALSTVNGYERQHLDFAAMSLRARRALVMALGGLLADADHAGAATVELIAEASDTIEEGLALALTLRPADFRKLRPLAERLFRLGIQVYSRHQPHFLGEFVLDLLSSPSFAQEATFREIARTALTEALTQERWRPPLLVAGTPAAERALLTARSLRAARDELALRLPRAPEP